MTPRTAGDGFGLFVLENPLPGSGMGLAPEDSWTLLSKADLGASQFAVSGADVASYDWKNQTLTLTVEATRRLASAFPGPFLSEVLDYQCFVVTLYGQTLYGGIILGQGSAMDIEFPSIFVSVVSIGSESERQVVFSIRPTNTNREFASFPESVRSQFQIPEVHDYFAGLGKLSG